MLLCALGNNKAGSLTALMKYQHVEIGNGVNFFKFYLIVSATSKPH